MKLKMLIGLAGLDFSLAPDEETERFSGDEANRLILAGYAVEAWPKNVTNTANSSSARKAAKGAAPETRG